MGAWDDGILDNDCAMDEVGVIEKLANLKNTLFEEEEGYVEQYSDVYKKRFKNNFRQTKYIDAKLKGYWDFREILATVNILMNCGVKLAKKMITAYNRAMEESREREELEQWCDVNSRIEYLKSFELRVKNYLNPRNINLDMETGVKLNF